MRVVKKSELSLLLKPCAQLLYTTQLSIQFFNRFYSKNNELVIRIGSGGSG
jgi:hypothetical protein